MKNNFLKRAITGILLVAVQVSCILISPLSFGIWFTIVSALTVVEFAHIINKTGEASMNGITTSLASAYLFVAFMGYCTDISNAGIFLPYLLLMLYMIISELYLKKKNPIGDWAFTMLSQVYVALPFALLNVIAFQRDVTASSGVSYNPIIPLSIFIFLWLSDSGAYCIGSLIGKHRLFERISPHKSWEGSIGGGIVTLLGAAVMSHFFSFMSIWQWLGLGAVTVVFGTLGDLVESLLKRQLEIKDSGHILPGHGGLLDRYDSSLAAIPAATIYIYSLQFFQ